MSTTNPLRFSNEVILYPLFFVVTLWLVFWIESRFHLNFNYLGINPSSWVGLRGVLLGPFIHSNLQHLFNNTIPLFVLMTSLFYFYRNIRWRVLILGALITGILTWLLGRPSNHIGASGVVYMLAAFLFFKGIFSKQYQLTALSFVVVFLYGSLVWYLFPIDPKISWEGHLSGFLVGISLALVFRSNPIENKKYAWQQEDYDPEEDEFLKHFDDQGNFIEKLPEDEIPKTEESIELPEAESNTIQIKYTYKKSPDVTSEDEL